MSREKPAFSVLVKFEKSVGCSDCGKADIIVNESLLVSVGTVWHFLANHGLKPWHAYRYSIAQSSLI
jgi:hypothetical protein